MHCKTATLLHSIFLPLTLGFLLMIGLSGCEKDTFLPTTEPAISALPEGPLLGSFAEDQLSQEYVSLDIKREIRQYFDTGDKMSGELQTLINSSLEKPAIIIKDEESKQKIVSFYLDVEDKSVLYNLVFLIVDDHVQSGQLYEYELGQEFAGNLNNNDSRINEFLGKVSINPAISINKIFQKDGFEDCFTAAVVNSVLNVSGGGGGGGGGDGGTGGTITGTIGGSDTGTGGSPDRDDLEHCYRTRVGEITGHVYLVLVDCESGEAIGDGTILVLHDDDTVANSTNKSKDKIDCDELIRLLGINTGVIDPNFDQTRNQRWVSLMHSTPFVDNAIAQSIIDLDVLSRCSLGATACAREQLQTAASAMLQRYASSLGIQGPQISGVPGGLTNAQLMYVTETLYIAELNNNASMFEGVRFALQHRNNPYVKNLFNSVIAQASILHQFDPEDYSANAAAYLTVLNKTEGLMKETTTTWLMMNADVLSRLAQPEIVDDITRDLAEIYVESYLTSEDFRALADSEFDAINPLLWTAIKEIGIEVGLKLAVKYIPGFNQIDNLKDLVRNAAQGDILGFLGEVLDIVKGFARNIPILAGLSLALDGIEVSVKASGAWRAIAKMERIGGDFAEKVLNTIQASRSQGRAAEILDTFKWNGRRGGASLNGLDSPEGFFDNLQEQFPNVTVLLPGQLQPQEIAGFVAGNLRIVMKFGGNTHPNGWTLEAKKGSSTYKIRFDLDD